MAKKIAVKGITYSRRFNLGNYEHEEYTAVAEVEGGNAVEAFGELKEIIAEAKGGDETGASKSSSGTKKQVESASPKAGKAAAKSSAKNKPSDDEEEETEEEELEDADDEEEVETEEDEEESEDEESEEEDEDEEEEAPAKKKVAKKAPAKAAGKKSFKSKATTYSRNSDLHKKLFVEAVKETMGANWLKANAGRGKTVSIKLEGKNFLDSDGSVLDTFKAELKKLAKAK